MEKSYQIEVGSRFIDINQDFENVNLITAFKKEGETFITWSNFPSDPTITDLKYFTGRLFPDLNGPHNKFDGRYIELSNIYRSNFGKLNDLIYRNPDHKISLKVANEFYNKFGLSEEEAGALIKLSIAKGFLNFKRQKGGDFLWLSEVIQNIVDRKKFLDTIADEVISKSERIELLVKHQATKGSYRETLLRNILSKYIPKKYTVATGFIEGCKRQCDIIIYDSYNFSPFFSEGELVVVPQKSVRAVIEVKSTLESNSLDMGLDLLADVAKLKNFPAPIFKGLFAFKKNGYGSAEGIATSMNNFYHKVDDATNLPKNEITYLYEGVNAVCVLNQECLLIDLIDFKFKDDSIRPRIYSVTSGHENLKIHTATFLSELFAFLDFEKNAKQVNNSYFNDLNNDIYYKLEHAIYEKGWLPGSSFLNEHKFTFETIWKRVSEVINWKAGSYTIQDLEEIYFSEEFKPLDYHERFGK